MPQQKWLQVLEDGQAGVHLVVGSHQCAYAHVVADLRPVQEVPEALSQPVDAYLRVEIINLECFVFGFIHYCDSLLERKWLIGPNLDISTWRGAHF